MTMPASGYAKLIEELGELSEAVSGMLICPSEVTRSMLDHMEQEMGDLYAAFDIILFINKFDLSPNTLTMTRDKALLDMKMQSGGEWAQLLEAMGSLVAVLGKKLAYWHTNEHPDGKSMHDRIAQHMGTVCGCLDHFLFNDEYGIDRGVVNDRRCKKYALFVQWHRDPNNAVHALGYGS